MRKLHHDLRRLESGETREYFTLTPTTTSILTEDGIKTELNLFQWTGLLHGPADTPYAGRTFTVHVAIPQEYPLLPPDIQFTAPIYHPNISRTGMICLSTLKAQPNGSWVPTMDLTSTMLSIHSLLADPVPQDPLNHEAGALYLTDRVAYLQKARQT
jgi:ubiquitin-protein ligase